MFTGIVQEVLTLNTRTKRGDCDRLTLTCPKSTTYVIGDSILLNGICSTITEINSASILVEYMPQTLQITTASSWLPGQLINCEPPLTLQTKLSGAIVLGHVDATAVIAALEPTDERAVIQLQFTQALPAYVLPQGGITVNGVNLTIVHVHDQTVVIHLIPHTFQQTTWHSSRAGEWVNIEFDYIAKLIWAQTQQRLTTTSI